MKNWYDMEMTASKWEALRNVLEGMEDPNELFMDEGNGLFEYRVNKANDNRVHVELFLSDFQKVLVSGAIMEVGGLED